MRFPSLSLLVAGFVLIPSACLARANRHKPSNGGNGSFKLTIEDFGSRILISSPSPRPTMDQSQDININMQMGLPFRGLLLNSHVPGRDDQSNFLTHSAKTAAELQSWPDGAYSQLTWCADTANQTMFNAMQACGPAASCDADFVTMILWGTLPGMKWAKDGLMLYQCLGIQTVKSQCKDPSKPPCKLKIIGDFHEDMWPKVNTLTIIGDGATSFAQMAQQIKVYNAAHHTNLSPPTS